MVMWISIVLCTMLVVGSASAIPKPEESLHNRVIDELSHVKHYQDETHNKQYDHEAFLGEEEAKNFDELAPEESQRRLGLIYDKIDTDQDGFINLYELQSWIKFTQRRYIDNDMRTQWKLHNKNNSEQLHWDDYFYYENIHRWPVSIMFDPFFFNIYPNFKDY